MKLLFLMASLFGMITNEVTDLKDAIEQGVFFKVKKLFDDGFELSDALKAGYLPLHHAVDKSYDAIADFIIRQGALVNTRSYHNRTPLHIAAMRNDWRMVLLLLARGAQVDAKDGANMTPYDLASSKRVKNILKNAKDYKDNWGVYRTSLDNLSEDTLKKIYYFASLKGDIQILEKLIKEDKIKPLKTTTGLLLAAKYDHPAAVTSLLGWKSVDIHAKDNKGRNALYLAVKTGDEEVVKPLLKAMNPLTDTKKELAGIATEKGYKQLAQLLAT